MTDIVDPATRSRMMSGIRGKNTGPELFIRSALHRRGFRFRLHAKDLPGKPDLVLPKYRAMIYIHGCFWHRHTCSLFKLPATRTGFWLTKIDGNVRRDQRNIAQALQLGWRVLIVWECAIRKNSATGQAAVVDLVAEWLLKDMIANQIDLHGLQQLPCSTTESAITLKV